MNHHVCKPAYQRWEVRKAIGGVYQVISPSGEIHANFNCKDNAETNRAAMEARDNLTRKRVTRSCLCCQRPFQSEGIHNRMCDVCRRQGEGPLPCGVASSPRGGRKPAR
jgi:hypothetical protein